MTRAELAAIDRQKWDERFLGIAAEVGKWSSCFQPNRQVGAVVAKNKRILTTGYNGAGSGVTSCKDKEECLRQVKNIKSGTCQEQCYAVHAEQNAIIQAARIGVSVDGATIYCTHQPCVICLKLLVNTGVAKVVYKHEYPDEFSREIADEVGMPMIQLIYEQ